MDRMKKQFPINVTHEDIVDVTLEFETDKGKRKIVKFALSYRAMINGKWYEVIRYDNAHGYVHVQKFWRGHEPIPLKDDEDLPFDYLVKKYKQDIVDNWLRYRGYIEVKVKE